MLDGQMYDEAWGPKDRRYLQNTDGVARVRGYVPTDELPSYDDPSEVEYRDRDDEVLYDRYGSGIVGIRMPRTSPSEKWHKELRELRSSYTPAPKKDRAVLTLKKSNGAVKANYSWLTVATMSKAGWPYRVIRFGKRAEVIFSAPNGAKEIREIPWTMTPEGSKEAAVSKQRKVAAKRKNFVAPPALPDSPRARGAFKRPIDEEQINRRFLELSVQLELQETYA